MPDGELQMMEGSVLMWLIEKTSQMSTDILLISQ